MSSLATLQTISLLLIDDHELFRFGVRAFMQPHPHIQVVGEAADGATGLALARQFQPAVILLDLQLPDMSGLQMLAQLRRDCPRSAVLMLTSSDDADDLAEALRGGACGYLSFGGEMDVAIAIRTGVIKDGMLYVQAAAGIVADSIPEMEWQETENKARAVLRAAEQVQDGLDGEL